MASIFFPTHMQNIADLHYGTEINTIDTDYCFFPSFCVKRGKINKFVLANTHFEMEESDM